MSSAPTITDVRCCAVVAPLPRPIATKILVIKEAPLLLVDLHTAEGITSRCYWFAFSRAGCGHLASVIADLGQRNRGAKVVPTALYDGNVKALSLFGHQGIAAMAIAAIDMFAAGHAHPALARVHELGRRGLGRAGQSRQWDHCAFDCTGCGRRVERGCSIAIRNRLSFVADRNNGAGARSTWASTSVSAECLPGARQRLVPWLFVRVSAPTGVALIRPSCTGGSGSPTAPR